MAYQERGHMQEGFVSFLKRYCSIYNFRLTDSITGNRIDESYKITDFRVTWNKARQISEDEGWHSDSYNHHNLWRNNLDYRDDLESGKQLYCTLWFTSPERRYRITAC